MSADFINISVYKFVSLDDLDSRRRQLLDLANRLELKGTVLLAPEGINLFVSGSRSAIDEFVNFLHKDPKLADLDPKESPSDHQPFSRMLVRIKKEIIAFGVETVDPRGYTSQKIPAEELKRWLDAGKDFTLLDVRNDYEVELGTFDKATAIGVDNFRDFPAAVRELPKESKEKPLVMFCTGGIRCEKAGPLMEQEGFKDVFQLDGGILKYFEEVGGSHYDGECFVFDKRVAVDPALEETATTQCYACQHPLSEEDQQSHKYDPPNECPYCYRSDEAKMLERISQRHERLQEITKILPGSVPYDNVRPLNVPGRFDQFTLIDFLDGLHPHVGRSIWLNKIAEGQIRTNFEPVTDPEFKVRGGQRFDHLLPQQTEPDVNAEIQILFEDDDMLVVDKPAPLPMHACGRFNRNTLIYILNEVYETKHLRIIHRLDAETSGIVVLARKGKVAKKLHQQFQQFEVEKEYLAEVSAYPSEDKFVVQSPISKMPGPGGAREVAEGGLEALTEFEIERRLETGHAVIRCRPKTGRTNQIRIHLAERGLPIVNDDVYGHEKKSGNLRLQAVVLSLNHPVHGRRMKFESQIPFLESGD